MQMINSLKAIIFLSVIGLFISCGGDSSSESSSDGSFDSKRAGVNEVIVHMNSDPDKLNIVTASSAGASEVQAFVFETLLTTDPVTLDYLPFMAKELGTMEEVMVDAFGEQKEGIHYSYEIREEAKWEDGSPITGNDFAFYVKCIKNPKVDCENIRPYLDPIIDVVVDKENPKKITVVFQNKYFMAEGISGGLYAMQSSKYDPAGLMSGFTINQLSNPANKEKLNTDENIIEFAKQFNSESFSRDIIVGSGAYEFQEWITGERVILTKKANWWGNQFVGKLDQFNNHPDKIVFEIIVDNTTAATAQKDEGLDIMKHASRDYIKLKEDEKFLQKYKFETPIAPQYSYIGLNTKSPKLSDKKVRQALAMALDYETLKKVFLYGLAERTVSPIHPVKEYYNKNITPYPFDLQAASAMLDEAGWIDSDDDGIRDKEVDGDLVQLSLEFKHPSGSDFAENMALVFKKSLSQIGVNLDVVAKEWTVFLEDTKSHNFDMVTMAWVMGSGLSDMKQIWHTDSYNGGSNYVGFGNAYTDELIENIRYELDETKRNEMYAEIQEIIYDESPYIFLFTGKSKIAIHRRYDNAQGYMVRPGYDVAKFKLNPSWGAATQSPE